MSNVAINVVFTHEQLTPIVGTPNFLSLARLQREMMANARCVPSTRWGGIYGHLGLVMTPAGYLAKTGHAFAPLLHPGEPPLQDGETAAQIHNADRIYDAALTDFKVYISTEARLRNQLIAAVPANFIEELQDFMDGYSNVTVIDMLKHLNVNYGKISPQEREANRAQLLSAWSPDQPIASLWARHNEIREFALAAGEPILAQTFIDQTITLFRNVGYGKYQSGIDAWRRLPDDDKTYARFKTHFTAEYTEIQLTMTTASAGYHQANVATENHSAAASTAPTTSNSPAPTNPFQVTGPCGGKMYYCWTHGLGKSANHTSRTCKKPRDGHNRDATIFTPTSHGGSTKMHIDARPSGAIDTPKQA